MPGTGPPAPRRHAGAFLITAAVTLAADVASKLVVVSSVAPGDVHAVAGSWVRLTHVLNSGAAFGLFPGGRVPLIAAAVFAVVAVGILIALRPVRRGPAVSLGLVIGGALGNLIDRVRVGAVIDFIDVGAGDYRWPVFNLADSAVTVGVILLAVALVRGERLSWAPEGEDSGAGLATPGDRV